MKKVITFCIGILIMAGCMLPSSKSTKPLGIDYAAYEQPNLNPADDFTAPLPQPSILAEAPAEQPEAAEEQTPSEDEDFTSEEIASSYGRYTDVTVVVAAKRIKLGTTATAKHMDLFQKALTAAYKKALRTYHPSGFTYSISSVGAVNPLSDIEVNCILEEQSANEVGQSTCNLFFKTLNTQYNSLVQEAQQNAAL